MKRGFFNSKKPKDQRQIRPVPDPPKQSQLSSDDAQSCCFPCSESNVFQCVDNISGDSVKPYQVVRIPSVKLTKSMESSSSCILRGSTCSTIVNTPGFYKPLAPPNQTNVSFTKNTPDMGVGLFAERSVQTNEVIFSERPLLIFPKELPFRNGRQSRSKEEAIKAHLPNFEEILQLALGAMSKEDADTYTSLSNWFPECSRLHGISRSNSFDISSDIEEEILEEGKFGYAAVGKLASKINHSCVPNIRVDFDVPTFSLRFIAEREIKGWVGLWATVCQLAICHLEGLQKNQ